LDSTACQYLQLLTQTTQSVRNPNLMNTPLSFSDHKLLTSQTLSTIYTLVIHRTAFTEFGIFSRFLVLGLIGFYL